MIDYINGKLSVSGNAEFYSASADELRVLLILLEQNRTPSPEEMAERAGVSVARAASAISYWENAGVMGTLDRRITYEFEMRQDEEHEEASVEVARTIRDESLATLLSECATILGKVALNDAEIKRIVDLYDRYGLSEEYLITLLTHLCRDGERCSVNYFVHTARSLSEKGVHSIEDLGIHLVQRRQRLEGERIYRALIGDWKRALTETEGKYLTTWIGEYGFGEEILRLAYNLAVDAGASRIPTYMNKLLTVWYGKDLHTPTACRADYEAGRETYTKAEKPSKKNVTRQGNFDPEEAFRLALERSYGSDTKEDS